MRGTGGKGFASTKVEGRWEQGKRHLLPAASHSAAKEEEEYQNLHITHFATFSKPYTNGDRRKTHNEHLKSSTGPDIKKIYTMAYGRERRATVEQHRLSTFGGP